MVYDLNLQFLKIHQGHSVNPTLDHEVPVDENSWYPDPNCGTHQEGPMREDSSTERVALKSNCHHLIKKCSNTNSSSNFN